jgi:glycosyltransferase involved in cell wall biosynthesis
VKNNLKENEEILVTVNMITYMHELYLAEAIECVLMQETNFRYDLIIADDCSPDKTNSIVDYFINTHPKGYIIKYFRHETNIGMHNNARFALENSNGKYIAFCEGDDYWIDRFKLQKQVDLLEKNPENVAIFHNCEIKYESEKKSDLIMSYEINKKEFKLEDLTSNNFVHISTFVFRSKYLPPEIFTKEYSALAFGDWSLVMLIARNGDILYMPSIMSVYRKNLGSTWGMQPEHVNIKKIIKSLQLLVSYNWFSQNINLRLNNTQKSLKRNNNYIFALVRKIKNKWHEINKIK